MLTTWIFRFAILAVGLLSGCRHDSLGRQAISGTVQVDGAPLAEGNISFQPTEGQATSGGAAVTSGQFVISQGNGLAAGKYRVIIHAPAPGTGGKAEGGILPGEAPTPPTERIPPEWNTASNQTIDVKKAGSNSFSLKISTKPADNTTN